MQSVVQNLMNNKKEEKEKIILYIHPRSVSIKERTNHDGCEAMYVFSNFTKITMKAKHNTNEDVHGSVLNHLAYGTADVTNNGVTIPNVPLEFFKHVRVNSSAYELENGIRIELCDQNWRNKNYIDTYILEDPKEEIIELQAKGVKMGVMDKTKISNDDVVGSISSVVHTFLQPSYIGLRMEYVGKQNSPRIQKSAQCSLKIFASQLSIIYRRTVKRKRNNKESVTYDHSDSKESYFIQKWDADKRCYGDGQTINQYMMYRTLPFSLYNDAEGGRYETPNTYIPIYEDFNFFLCTEEDGHEIDVTPYLIHGNFKRTKLVSRLLRTLHKNYSCREGSN